MKAISEGLRKEVEAVALAKGIDMSSVQITQAEEALSANSKIFNTAGY